ncbi:MAG: helix-turn-helix domain-containing protein [Anaerovoracaceae bacterium]
MDSYKTGKFIAQKRKEKGLTQRALAEKIGVTDKAISKWERGLSCPDISLLLPLSDALGTNVTEILNGSAIDEINVELSDDILVSSVQNYVRYTSKESKKQIAAVALILIIVFMTACFVIHLQSEKEERCKQIDMVFSDLLCEIEMSFDYGQELLKDANPDICRHLDRSTSEVMRLSEKYKSLLLMYYGEKMSDVCSGFDKLKKEFLFIHHSIPNDLITADNKPIIRDEAYCSDLKTSFRNVMNEIDSAETALENSQVYYGHKELSKTTLQHLRSMDICN